ncbi:PLC-like phosphodiesterase [Calocera viscosa TUFC12733]|uniref:PLC-like phosphodiesterase n=1 Tax=Calocera viscosa (strain TUFC12733) TaxID=1330018 RepID=A0A167I8X5_CALVF|nr:PLC-like phosphodiesterase [Calocera viscosa TUFC12733]
MLRKGIDVYCYVSLPGAYVNFSLPGKDIIRRDSSQNFTGNQLDLEWPHADWRGRGCFKWTVFGQAGNVLVSREVTVNAMTGSMYGASSIAPFDTPAVMKDDHCVCYGYYVAGKGVLGLSDRHQIWVTVTPRRDNWMGDLIPPGSAIEQRSFSLFVLPGTHNAGMNTMDKISAFMRNQTKAPIIGATAVKFTKLSSLLAWRCIHNLAITQKESVTDMLKIGTRMFDFRPAFLYGVSAAKARSIENVYATHARIPGISMAKFLKELVSFLEDNTTEIVVLCLKHGGSRGCEKPTRTQLKWALESAFPASIQVGWGYAFLGKSVAELRASKTRVIIPEGAKGFDTWKGENHRAFSPEKIINNVFEKLTTERQAEAHITRLRCALTPTATGRGIIAHSAISGPSSSPLMEVKARSDIKTLKWIRDHALERLKADTSITVGNDFIDGQTVDACVSLSARRFGVPDPVLMDGNV